MHSSNTLHLIASYLTYQDLLSLSQVNSLAYSITNRQDLWKQETYRLFLNTLDIFDLLSSAQTRTGCITIKPILIDFNWKNILKQAIEAKKGILRLSGAYFTENQAEKMSDCIVSMLVDPAVPMPCLRREGRTYPTILQDYIAMKQNSEVLIPVVTNSSSEFISEMMYLLDSYGDELYREFSDSDSKNLLAMARWNLKRFLHTDLEDGILTSSRNSIQSTAESYENSMDLDTPYTFSFSASQPFLIQLFRSLKKQISWYCKLQLAIISQATDSDSFIREYIKRWKAFSVSITELDQAFNSFNLLLSDIHDSIWRDLPLNPEFSLMRTMVIQWRRKVFTPCKDVIFSSIHNLIQRLRTQSWKSMDKNEFYLISSAILSLVDLSVNEQNVHFTDHSQFDRNGVYNILHDLVLRWTEQFYTDNLPSLSIHDKVLMLKNDLELIEKLFLPCTVYEVKKLNLNLTINALWEYLEESYRQLQPVCYYVPPLRQETLDMILYSELGRRLFHMFPSHQSKQNVTSFIEQLASSNKMQYVTWFLNGYDEIEGMKNSYSEDIEVECRAERLGFEQELSILDRFLYSMSSDLTLNQFLCIIDRNL